MSTNKINFQILNTTVKKSDLKVQKFIAVHEAVTHIISHYYGNSAKYTIKSVNVTDLDSDNMLIVIFLSDIEL